MERGEVEMLEGVEGGETMVSMDRMREAYTFKSKKS